MSEPEKPVKKRVYHKTPIRQLRKYFGLTPDQFAAHLDVSIWTLKEWEMGRCEPRAAGWTLLNSVFVSLAMERGMDRKAAIGFVAERLFPVKR